MHKLKKQKTKKKLFLHFKNTFNLSAVIKVNTSDQYCNVRLGFYVNTNIG